MQFLSIVGRQARPRGPGDTRKPGATGKGLQGETRERELKGKQLSAQFWAILHLWQIQGTAGLADLYALAHAGGVRGKA